MNIDQMLNVRDPSKAGFVSDGERYSASCTVTARQIHIFQSLGQLVCCLSNMQIHRIVFSFFTDSRNLTGKFIKVVRCNGKVKNTHHLQ